MQDRGPAAYIGELIGTLVLVFAITMAVSLFVTQASPQNPAPFVDWSVVGLVNVFVLFLLIQTLAVVSGAHFNPAVTAAMTVLRQIRPPDAAIYIILQVVGAVLGALLCKFILDDFPNADAANFGAPAISEATLDGDLLRGAVVEGIGTFLLVWAIVGVAVSPRGLKDWSGFAIGATLGLTVMLAGPLTGGAVNPARAFGAALASGEFGGAGDFLVAYILAPVIGGLLAALAYFRLFLTEGAKGPGGAEPVG